ncbi:hypothetical protein [Companilactobacillus allii]|nr:hypothetical protein [Companilactobacillus allii]
MKSESTEVTPSKHLEQVIQKEIDAGKFKKIDSKKELDKFLSKD